MYINYRYNIHNTYIYIYIGIYHVYYVFMYTSTTVWLLNFLPFFGRNLPTVHKGLSLETFLKTGKGSQQQPQTPLI